MKSIGLVVLQEEELRVKFTKAHPGNLLALVSRISGVPGISGVSGVSGVSDVSLTRFPDLLNDSHWNVNQSWTSCWMVDPSSFSFLS